MKTTKIDIDSLMNAIIEKQKTVEQLVKDMTKTAQTIFSEGLSDFFKAFPEVGTITWTQYTPYFNDGETCEFNRHEINFIPSDELLEKMNEGEEDDDKDYSIDDEVGTGYFVETRWYKESADAVKTVVGEERAAQLAEAVEKLGKLLETIPEDVYAQRFGDHVRVRITASGTETEDYDHD